MTIENVSYALKRSRPLSSETLALSAPVICLMIRVCRTEIQTPNHHYARQTPPLRKTRVGVGWPSEIVCLWGGGGSEEFLIILSGVFHFFLCINFDLVTESSLEPSAALRYKLRYIKFPFT